MGRPLNKRFFANKNEGGVGADSVASVALGTAGTGYSQGLAVTASAPQLAGGVTAIITPVVNATTGAIESYSVTDAGSGYTSAPTLTLVQPATKTPTATGADTELTITVSSAAGLFAGMEASGTGIATGAKIVSIAKKVVTLSLANTADVSGTVTFTDVGASAVPGAVTLTAGPKSGKGLSLTAITVGSTARTNSDIVKQTGSRRYIVKNQDGQAICKLVAAVPAVAGEANLVATDSSGKTYYVTKLTSHKAFLVQFGAAGHEFASNTVVKWTFDAPVANVSVTVSSI